MLLHLDVSRALPMQTTHASQFNMEFLKHCLSIFVCDFRDVVIKAAASAASLHGGRASGRLDHGFFLQFLVALAAKK